AKQDYDGSLNGTISVTDGLGGRGGAQPLADTKAGGVCITTEGDDTRIDRRIETRYADVKANSLEEAIRLAEEEKLEGKAFYIDLLGNSSDILPEIIARNFIPDVLTDQTSAHDPLNGYTPSKMSLDDAAEQRVADPEAFVKLSKASMAQHVRAMLEMMKKGAVTFDYGNNIRQVAKDEGVENAFDFPGF